jgi:hypothetical protein
MDVSEAEQNTLAFLSAPLTSVRIDEETEKEPEEEEDSKRDPPVK